MAKEKETSGSPSSGSTAAANDYVLANPPFNDSDSHPQRRGCAVEVRPAPKGNANFARGQHFILHVSPSGFAGFVLANGSMSSNQSGEGEIRKVLATPCERSARAQP